MKTSSSSTEQAEKLPRTILFGRIRPKLSISWETVIGIFFVSLAFLKLSGPLRDNSLFTHIATGRLIIGDGAVPMSDPYTFTAEGTPWVVQSWLVSYAYATIEQIFGAAGIRLFAGLVAVALFSLLWKMSRPLNTLLRVFAVGLLTLTGLFVFSPRPTLFGLLFIVLVAACSRGFLRPFILLPVGILWVNMHGSWPIGVGFAALLLIGSFLDRKDWKVDPLRSFAFLVGGILVGSLGPLGFTGLTFPLEMFERQDVLSYISEWRRPPIFGITTTILWTLFLIAAVGWKRNKTWTSALTIVVAIIFGLLANRNISVASFLLFFPIVDGMQNVGKLKLVSKSVTATALGVAFVALFFGLSVFNTNNWDYSAYPEEATDQLEQWGWMKNSDVVVAGQMGTGNYWSLRYGPDHKILYDDRFDMYDKDLINELVIIDNKKKTPEERIEALELFSPDVVVWDKKKNLPEALQDSDRWKEILSYSDGWLVFCRVGSESVPCN